MRKKAAAEQKQSETPTPDIPKTAPQALGLRKALVFISHDSRDAELAEAFANLLTDASGGMLASFRSSDRKGTAGLDFGSEWYSAIMEKLDNATDVVALLTESSMNRPWILYEAGVAKGKLDTDVLGVLIGVPERQANIGPFAQFHNSGDDEDSLTKLVLQLIRRNPEANPREEAVRRDVAEFRRQMPEILSRKSPSPESATAERAEEASVTKLFEEIKVILAELPDRVRGRRRVHPMMIEEMMHMSQMMDKHGDGALGVLIFISVFRDQCPWLYEVGMEVYRALREGDQEAALVAARRMRDLAEFSLHGPWMEELMPDREAFMAFRHMPEMLERMLQVAERPSRARRQRPEGADQQ
jgi:hypothetical protein